MFGLGYLFASRVALVKERMHQAELVAFLLLAGLGMAWSTVRRRRGARLVAVRPAAAPGYRRGA